MRVISQQQYSLSSLTLPATCTPQVILIIYCYLLPPLYLFLHLFFPLLLSHLHLQFLKIPPHPSMISIHLHQFPPLVILQLLWPLPIPLHPFVNFLLPMTVSILLIKTYHLLFPYRPLTWSSDPRLATLNPVAFLVSTYITLPVTLFKLCMQVWSSLSLAPMLKQLLFLSGMQQWTPNFRHYSRMTPGLYTLVLLVKIWCLANGSSN